MKKLITRIVMVVIGILVSANGFAQSDYSDHNSVTRRLKALERSHGKLVSLSSLTKSPNGHDIWLLTIGGGDTSTKPAVAVIGGAEGAHLLGTELALGFAEKLLANSDSPEIKSLLESTTYYVVPGLNPDAAQQYFATLTYERGGNGTKTDDDRDGAFDEDPFEDLNGDGLVTMMRVQDPTGSWKISDIDPRVMVKAEPGENGEYLLFTEGRDNDSDGHFNEDGEGGVNINKNFTFDFPYFEAGAGENMASQPENIALMDFLFDEARNVFAVVSFGPADNLSKALKFNRGAVSKRVVSGWYEDDVEVNELISGYYNDATDLGKDPAGDARQGDLFQWAYYHYGRFSFSTPGWWTPEISGEKFETEEAHYLAWADSNGIDAFVEWQEIDHPDFEGKKVEIGGLKPFSGLPPYSMVDSLAQDHTDFLIKVGEAKPMIELVNMKREKTGKNLTRITVDVYNSGLLPTASHLGTRTSWVRDVMIDADLSGDLEFVSGNKRSYVESIAADGFETYSWLVRGKGTFTLKAGAPQAGFATKTETIK
ncbi:MAG TPA: peptidase [Balneolaceae bacterium]|nr:peptidase [Balneolaceae bacterium]|tara:strand:- start:2761 stop:4377 length:1617 start_codon:yes stop_codon:yes gene_type:complete